MFSCFLRFLLFVIVCLAVAHAYPSSMSKLKWVNIPTRVARPYIIHDEQASNQFNLANENDNDLNDSNGLATWLFRSRKFCCAPPL